MVTATFGPRYTCQPAHHHRDAFYGQTLVGEVIGFNSIFPGTGEAKTNANSRAVKIGGGMNYTLSRRLDVRAFETE